MDRILKSIELKIKNKGKLNIDCTKGTQGFLDSIEKALEINKQLLIDIFDYGIDNVIENIELFKNTSEDQRKNFLGNNIVYFDYIVEENLDKIYIVYEIDNKEERISFKDQIAISKLSGLVQKNKYSTLIYYNFDTFSNMENVEVGKHTDYRQTMDLTLYFKG